MAEADYDGAKADIDRWSDANPDSVQVAYAQRVLGHVEFRTLLPDWPDTRGALNAYCETPKVNPLLDPATAGGVVLLSAEALSEPIDAGHLARTASTAEGDIDEDAVRSILNSALADNL